MATGTGMGFDFTQLDKDFERLDKKFDKLISKSKNVGDALSAAFAYMEDAGLEALGKQLTDAKKKIVKFGNEKRNITKWDSTSLKEYINMCNRLKMVIEQVAKEQKKWGIKPASTRGLTKEIKDSTTLLSIVKETEKEKKASAEQRNTTYSAAMRYSQKDLTTLEQEREAVRRLQVAREGLKKTDSEYENKLRSLNNEMQRHTNNIAKATGKQRSVTYSDAMGYSKGNLTTLEQEREAVRMLQEAREKLDKTDANYTNQLRNLNKEIERHNTNITNATRGTQNQVTYKSAMGYSKGNLTTLEQEREAVRMLQVAREKLDKTDAEYAGKLRNLNNEIKRHNANIAKATGEQRKLGNQSSELKRIMMSLFSAQQVVNYVRHLISVRGEFELQQKALQSILQNKDEANALWEKTIALAVKSPFTVGQLVGYTKALAAYRIESEKLFETNKMLADISAGLGVDMNRLILAYGQVRAASFLRGTELRQFTEAGIPLLEALADRFEKLYGRVYSVGDVFEMVSKRMVYFEDVDAVLREMTSEGGTFYRMQEIQAETLKGQVSNLKDAIEIAINEMGEQSDGALKRSVNWVRQLVINWREVAVIAQAILYTVGGWKIGKLFLDISRGYTKLTGGLGNVLAGISLISTQTKKYNKDGVKGFKAVGKSINDLANTSKGFASVLNGIKGTALMVLLGIAIKLIAKFSAARKEAREFRAEMKRINQEELDNFDKKVESFEALVHTLERAARGSKEYTDAMNKINSEYGEYLNFVVDENTRIADLAASYDTLVVKMREASQQRAIEKGMEQLDSDFLKKASKEIKGFTELIKGLGIFAKNGKDYQKILPTDADANAILSLYNRRAKKLTSEELKDRNALVNLLNEVIGDYYRRIGKDGQRYEYGLGLMAGGSDHTSLYSKRGAFSKYNDVLLDWKEREEEFMHTNEAFFGNIADNKQYIEELAEAEERYNERVRDARAKSDAKKPFVLDKTLQDLKTDFEEEQIDLKLKFGLITEETAEVKRKALRSLKGLWNDIQNAVDELIEEGYDENRVYQLLGVSESIRDRGPGEYLKKLKENYETDLEELRKVANQTYRGLGGKEVEATRKDLVNRINTYLAMSEKLGHSVGFPSIGFIDREKFNEIQSKIKKRYRLKGEDMYKDEATLVADAKKKMDDAKNYVAQLEEQQRNGTEVARKTMDAAKEAEEQYTLLWKLLGGLEKSNSGGGGGTDPFQKRLQVIKELAEEYRKLKKTMHEEDAVNGAFAKVKDAYEEAFEGTFMMPEGFAQMLGKDFIEVWDYTTENGIVNMFDNVKKLAVKENDRVAVELAKKNFILETKIQLKEESDKALKDKVEELFNNYDLSIDFKGLGLDDATLERLFGHKTTTLEQLEKDLKALEDSFVGTDMVEEYKKYLKKLEDARRKSYVDDAKEFTKFLKNQLLEVERVENEGARNIALADRLFSEGKITVEQYLSSVRNIVKETKDGVKEVSFELFKESPEYVKAMGSLFGYTRKELISLRDTLEDNLTKGAGNMGVEEMEAYSSAITKVNDKIARMQSPKDVGMIATFKKLIQNQKDFLELQKESDKLDEKKKDLLKQLTQLQNATNTANAQGMDTSKWQAEIKKLVKELGLTDDQMKAIASRLGIIASESESTAKNFNEYINAFMDISKSVTEVLESYGVDVEEGIGTAIEGAGHLANAAGHIVDGDWGKAVIEGIKGVAKFITSVNQMNDDYYQREIERHEESLERLNKAYGELEESISNAYSIEDIQKYNKEMEVTYELQKKNLEAMIAAEEAKKNTDDEKIKEWKSQLKELDKERNEFLDSLTEDLGGVLDFKSATRGFVDAWVSAFRETGSGLDALNEEFTTFFDDVVKNQATLLVTKQFLAPFYESLNESLEDFRLTQEEVKDLRKQATDLIPALDETLKLIWGEFGGEFGGSKLSGLQKGIQGVTEETAQVIEGLLNSMRAFVADSNNELKQQTRYMRETYSLLDSLTTAYSKGGRGFKVVMS